MTYLILIAVSLMLLGGFLMLAAFERSRGLRIAGDFRNRLDKRIARLSFIARHVDWGAFVKHLAGTIFERVLHDVAHAVLRVVRITERLLTRMVKSLRERRGIGAPEEESEEEAHPLQAGIARVRTALRHARAASRKPAKRELPEAGE